MDAPRSQTPDLTMFLASSVHDMKNSLSVLLGGLERVLGTCDPDTFPEYDALSGMVYEARRINSNLVQLLTLYKLGADSYPFDPADHPVREFLEVIAAQNAPLLKPNDVVLDVDCADDLYAHFDEDLVAGVIGHALNNAIKYTRSRVRLAARNVYGGLELRIEDDGPGYPEKMIREGVDAMHGVCFASGSTGLGLLFSAAVAKLHRNHGRQGELRLENGGALGGGCLVLQLP